MTLPSIYQLWQRFRQKLETFRHEKIRFAEGDSFTCMAKPLPAIAGGCPFSAHSTTENGKVRLAMTPGYVILKTPEGEKGLLVEVADKITSPPMSLWHIITRHPSGKVEVSATWSADLPPLRVGQQAILMAIMKQDGEILTLKQGSYTVTSP